MAFQVQVTGVDELSDRRMMTDVTIDRKLYGHSEAQVVVRRQKEDGFPDRTAALVAAKALNCPVEITWRDGDLAEATPCFQGYVQHASAQRLPTLSVLTLSCVSYSKRTDLVPRFRAFQATTLHDIAQQIARTEPLFKIVHAGDLNVPIPLSLQHGETDFAYLTRMLGAWGVPMATEDRTGRVLLGARGQEPPVPFPDADWGWSHLTFEGALQALPSLVPGGGSGAAGLARQALGRFLGQMTPKAAGYHFTPDQAQRSATHAQTASQTGTGRAEMHIAGAVLPFAPGHVVEVEGVPQLINAVSIRGRTNETTASQTFALQQPTLPITAKPAPPAWMLHPVWAYVTDNAHDPDQQGRVQVEFETEPLDPQMAHERAWLHTLTPYGGGIGPGGARLLPDIRSPRAHAYSAGFYSLPEVGERVLVQFLGLWDSDAVVLGAVRHGGVTPTDNARDTKRWRTPSGNEIALTTQGEGPHAKDTVDFHAQGRPVFQAVVDKEGESVSVQCAGSYVHLLNKSGEVRVEVFSGGAMLLHANGHLQIEGDSVQIKAKGGGGGVKIGGKTTGTAKGQKKSTLGHASTPYVHTGRYHSVIATRKGRPHLFAAYQDANGKVQEVRTGGTAAWRYNNPGNMNPGSVASRAGAIGKAWVEPYHHSNTAVFPDEKTGYAGAVALLKTKPYQTRTMEETVRRWVGVDLGQLPQYTALVQQHSGIQPTQLVGNLNDAQLDKMAHAMSIAEG